MEFRKIKLTDEEAYQQFEAVMLEDKKTNPFVEWWHVYDFQQFVANSDQSEIRQENQSWSPYTRYFAFLDGAIAGVVICFWEMEHPDCQTLGHVGYMVAPAFRHQGIASQLVRFAQNKYRERGISQFYLVTDQKNEASRSLIGKLGGKLSDLEEIDYRGTKMQSARYILEC